MNQRPPERRIVVPNYNGSGKPHKDQLRDLAETILELMRNSAQDPKAFETYCKSYAHLDKLLSGELSTERKQADPASDHLDSLSTEELTKLAETRK